MTRKEAKKLRVEEDEAAEQAQMEIDQAKINEVADRLDAWKKLDEKYMALTKQVFGEIRRGNFTSWEETVAGIEEMEDRLANPEKYIPQKSAEYTESINQYDSQSITAKR